MTPHVETSTELALKLRLSRATSDKLAQRAAETGKPLNEYASELIEHAVNTPSLDEVLAPVRAEFEDSGMSDDELSDVLEKAKHQMRAERRGSSAP
jgi:hypothetical protein